MSIKVVNSFDELVSTPFANGINAFCWQRHLPGDFNKIVDQLNSTEAITTLDESRLNALPLSDAGKAARTILLEDQKLLRDHGLSPTLDCILDYPRDEDSEVVPTDVYSFHVDSAQIAADTYLCSYTGAASEGLPQDEAIRKVDIPENRAALLEIYGGPDDDGFREFLRECCYDLHYAPLASAQPFSFGRGNLWRIALQYPDCPVPPCIHRAPASLPDQSPRLLLIS
jgi:hypothetical protein